MQLFLYKLISEFSVRFKYHFWIKIIVDRWINSKNYIVKTLLHSKAYFIII